jgi:hypothetical protein
MKPKSSSPYPQGTANCPYPEPTPSSTHDPLQLPEDLTFQVLSNMSLFRLRLRDTSSRNIPPGDPSGGVVYLRTILSPEKASQFMGNS